MSKITDNIALVRQKIDAAAKKVGRNAADITIVAVTKTASLEAIQEAKAAGLTVFGENRIQEALEKVPHVQAEWHLVGHLQSNKIKTALSLFSLFQSVDSVRLAEKINEVAESEGRTVPILLEINISKEEQKYGFGTDDIYAALDEIGKFSSLRVKGLMGIAPNTPDAEARRASFKLLRQVFSACKSVKKDNVEMKILSMGMSDDYEIAIEEGSNMVRLGRCLFK